MLPLQSLIEDKKKLITLQAFTIILDGDDGDQ